MLNSVLHQDTKKTSPIGSLQVFFVCMFVLFKQGWSHLRGVKRDTTALGKRSITKRQAFTEVVAVLSFLQVFGVLLVAFFLLLLFYTVFHDVRRKMGT